MWPVLLTGNPYYVCFYFSISCFSSGENINRQHECIYTWSGYIALREMNFTDFLFCLESIELEVLKLCSTETCADK